MQGQENMQTRFILKFVFAVTFHDVYWQDIPDDVFDLYCWIHSTYTIPRALSLHVGRDVAHPGVMTRYDIFFKS